MKDGFVKVAAASPVIRVADPDYNADRVIETIQTAKEKGVKVLVFPELTLTGVTCYDLIGMRNLLNASEDALCKVVEATEELDMLVFACADTLDEAKAIALLHPDFINPEPSEIIGGGKGASPMAYVMDSIKAIKAVDPSIMVEQAAGITCGQEVYDFIMAGSEAAGAASGIMNAEDPIAMIDEMIAATRRAADDLKKQNA